jgi:PAS domain S-box-containing protein
VVIGVLQDITEQKATELALRESEAKFRSVFGAVPAGLAVSGFEPEVLQLAHADVGSSRQVELQLRGKNRDDRLIRCAAQVLDINSKKMLITAFVDVTDARRAERERQRAEQRYRELVQGVRDVVFALTPAGVLTSLNPAFERITGLVVDDWIGRRFDELVHPDDAERARAELQQAVRLGPADTPPLRIKRADGSYCLGEINVAPHFEDGLLVSLLGTKLRPGLRAIFMSGYTDKGATLGRDLGSAILVQKPFKPETLLRAVRTALD